MKKIVTLRQALDDRQYFGGQLVGESWAPWRSLLLAIMGEELSPGELTLFQALTGRQRAPLEPVREFAGIVGRRGGKSRAMGILAAFLACCVDHRAILAPGELGVLPVLAATKTQAANAYNFVTGAIAASPALRSLIVGRTADTLSLSTGIDIVVRPASFRSVRGATFVAAICDEIAFFRTEDNSVNVDLEIIRALRPGLLISKGPLIAISSPYAKRGYLWNTYRKNYGVDGNPKILVAQAASQVMNSSVDMDWIADQFAEDPVAAEAEYNAVFRSDVQTFVDREIIDACVIPGRFELPFVKGVKYEAFCDLAGGGSDAMTLAIGHRQNDIAIIDALREIKPPCSPEAVIIEFAELLKSYGLYRVQGDRYALEWPRERFRLQGISYEQSARPKSELYQSFLPLLNSGKVELLDNAVLVSQLANLERRTARGGRDSIDHPSGNYHDDVCNSVAGVASLCCAYIQRGPVAQTGTFRTHVYDTNEFGEPSGGGRLYKLGCYGQRIEVIPDWAERGERYAPGDPRWKLVETNNIAHDH
jgi:hypothetical protein